MDRRQLVREYLDSHAVMTLATTGGEGAAAAAVLYASVGLEIYLLSAPTTRHARNMEADPRVAVTIQDEVRDWSRIRGLQLQGSATVLEGAARAQARSLHAAKFPEIFGAAQLPAAIVAALERVRWYRIAINRIRYIDNAAGFGHADEWSAAEFLRQSC